MVGRAIMNPYVGDMPIDVGGERLTLSFTWDALARIRSELGQEGQTKALTGDTEALCVLVAIGLACHHPDWTAERVRAASPAVVPTLEAVQKALAASFFGAEGAPKEQSENPPQPPQTRLNRLWGRLLKRE